MYEHKELVPRISNVIEDQGYLPIDSNQIMRFAEEIQRMHAVQQDWLKMLERPSALGTSDIIYWIDQAQKCGDLDEALWRAFLAAHFGRTSCDGRAQVLDSPARLLCGFGDEPMWTWEKVCSNPEDLSRWLVIHSDELKNLKFGNHRKYESKKPEHLSAVMRSFIDWVIRSGGRPKMHSKSTRIREQKRHLTSYFTA